VAGQGITFYDYGIKKELDRAMASEYYNVIMYGQMEAAPSERFEMPRSLVSRHEAGYV